MTPKPPDYFRRDQADGVTAPDLSKDCSYAEHIVRARGKRTQLTSVSLDPQKINDFGPALYRALRPDIDGDGPTTQNKALPPSQPAIHASAPAPISTAASNLSVV